MVQKNMLGSSSGLVMERPREGALCGTSSR